MPNLHDFSWPSQKCYLEWGNLLVELCNQVDQYEWRYTWFVRFGQKKESFVKSIQLDTPLSVQPNSCLKMRPRRKFGFPQVWKSWCGFPFQCLLLASYPGGEIFCFNLLTCCHWYFSSAWNIFRENNIVFHTQNNYLRKSIWQLESFCRDQPARRGRARLRSRRGRWRRRSAPGPAPCGAPPLPQERSSRRKTWPWSPRGGLAARVLICSARRNSWRSWSRSGRWWSPAHFVDPRQLWLRLLAWGKKLKPRQVFSYKKSDTANKISRHILKRIYVITLKLVGKILEDL